ncbi:acyltransferase [Prosthecobacter sp.]|uniref:acyltransferase family protein n=1 Tax=Prosthecobacter sp. TaxID=1965333 RepID=UPI001DDD3782|nr:acyltransferase [Prosthecobacter sp.]MCB1277982.1 acyltransferase [Prosthecobacter sp.]
MESIITTCCLPNKPAGQARRSAAASPERFEGLTIIRMAAAFYVVFHHMTADNLKGAPTLVAFASDVANDLGWSVPFFLLLAGFLMARSVHGGAPAQVSARCFRSAKRVLWLWLGWSLVYLLNPPLKPLLHLDIAAVTRHYAEVLSSNWPRMIWVGTSYHLWFSGSLLMAWLLMAFAARMQPRLATVLVQDSRRVLKLGVGMALIAGGAIWLMPRQPMSGCQVGLEVVVVHALLPFSFVIMGASLWQYRSVLSSRKAIACLICLGIGLRMIETEWLSLDLNSPGPRRMYASNLLFGSAALAIGLQLPLKKSLSGVWLVTPGIYCVHMLVISRLEALHGPLHNWIEQFGVLLAVFVASLAISFVLSRFKTTSVLAT